MPHTIELDVKAKHAEIRGKPEIVNGNSDYTLTFDFDAEWEHAENITAQIVYVRQGERISALIPVTNGQCSVPTATETSEILVSVFADCIRTAAPAVIPCVPCITDYHAKVHVPQPDTFNYLMELLAEQQAKDRIRYGMHMELGFFTHNFLANLTHEALRKGSRS